MKPFLPKHSLIFSSSRSQSRAHVLQLFHFSSSSPSPSSYPYYRRRDDESRNVMVSVWWDFDNCNIPPGVSVRKIVPAITEALRMKGIKGPLQLKAFGDVLQHSRANREALVYTAIQHTHIPNGGKNTAYRSLLVELMFWVSENPPPAHLFLISGDKDFAGLLHRLRMNNYNILLATTEKAPVVLCSAATIVWQWSLLIKGEDLSGKHFNHPPGPLDWYGNYKIPLKNPFSAAASSPYSSYMPIVADTPMAQSHCLKKAFSIDSKNIKAEKNLHGHASSKNIKAEESSFWVKIWKRMKSYVKF